MKSINYKQGMTKVYVDKEKLVITNTSGKQHIKANVDEIFGVGEFDKIYAVKYFENVTPGRLNPHAKTVEITSGYIPERALVDLGKKKPKKKKVPEDSLPGTKGEDLIKEYFDDS